MAVRTIVTGVSHPILRARAKEVSSISRELQGLLTDLHETVSEVKGAGLAAPQLGESLRACVAKIGGDFTPLINPEILWRSSEILLGEEGCLSLPEIWLLVPRAREIVLRFHDEKWRERELRLAEFDARVVQHEIDHLEGKLIVDYQQSGAVVPGQAL